MKRYLTVDDPLHEIDVVYSFSENEWRSIEVFKRRAKDFLVMRGRLKVGIITASVQRHENGTYSGIADTPSEDWLLPYYLTFRHFYLQKEPGYFPKVATIIGNCSCDATLRMFIRKIKNQWKGTLAKDAWLKYKGESLSAKVLLNLWFNAHYFHSEIEKETELTKLNSVLSTDISRHCLFMSVHDASLAIANLYKSIEKLEERGGKISFPLRLVKDID
jgi:hypothetical protein